MSNYLGQDAVLCPNPDCKRIFSTAYTTSRKCPFCGTMYMPYDTMAGSPDKSIESQVMLARAFRGDEQW